ncbi:MAG: hypothetical protein V4495_08995 [Pseudomonadota bacterium]
MSSTTFSLTQCILLAKTYLIRINRLLAWAMVIAPVLQFFIQARLEHALLLDFGLLVTHGILSLMLFGLPKVKQKKFVFIMHVMGIDLHPLSPRHDFLMSGYRLALGVFACFLLFIPNLRWLALLFFYPLMAMMVFFIQHLYGAIAYAFARWGIKRTHAGRIVCIYLFFFICNLLHAL